MMMAFMLLDLIFKPPAESRRALKDCVSMQMVDVKPKLSLPGPRTENLGCPRNHLRRH